MKLKQLLEAAKSVSKKIIKEERVVASNKQFKIWETHSGLVNITDEKGNARFSIPTDILIDLVEQLKDVNYHERR